MQKLVELTLCTKDGIAHESLFDSVRHQTTWDRERYDIDFGATTDREVTVEIEVHCDDDILSAGVMFGECLKNSFGLFERAYWMIGFKGNTE
ncbi:MAG: hypothetical protein IPG77_04930 [Betaproteobacteria bacterium]|nr:hypothetical protein [Betaproteobacteria bacterium]